MDAIMELAAMVDLEKPDRVLQDAFGYFRFDEVDPGWVAPQPWGHYEPFHELHGIRRTKSAPGVLPVHHRTFSATAPRPEAVLDTNSMQLGPEAAFVPAHDSLGTALPRKGQARGRSSSWAGTTWHTGFLHAKHCLAECQAELRHKITFRWAFSGEPVMSRHSFMHSGGPTCFTLPGYMTWHELAWLLQDATGLRLSRLHVIMKTGCRLRWLQFPHHSPAQCDAQIARHARLNVQALFSSL